MKQAGRKRGPKAAGEEAGPLEQLTVRLDPKYRFGINMMARANHQSLAEAVQWAVKTALHTVKVNSCGTLGTLVDRVWGKLGFELLWRTWELEPNLLTLEERSIVRLVKQSDDLFLPGARRQPDFAFIDAHYDALKALSTLWMDMGYTHEMRDLRTQLVQMKKSFKNTAEDAVQATRATKLLPKPAKSRPKRSAK